MSTRRSDAASATLVALVVWFAGRRDGFSRSLKASIGCTEKGTHIINLTFSRDRCVIKFLVDCREIISKLD